MSDLISRQDAIDAIRKNVSKSDTEDSLCFNLGLGVAEKEVESLPSAEAVQGEWIFNPTDAIDLMFAKPKCSKCGFESSDGGNFCPNCGVRMNKGGEDE